MLSWCVLLIVVVHSSGLHLTEILRRNSENDDKLSDLVDKYATSFETQFLEYRRSGLESPELRDLSQELAALHSGESKLFISHVDDLDLRDQFFVCLACRATVSIVARTFLDPKGDLNGPNRTETTRAVVLDVCRRLDIQSDDVCGGMFDFNWPIIDFIMQNTIIDSRSMCGALPIKFCKAKQKEFNWNLKIDSNDPNQNGVKSEPPMKSDNDLVLLHLTDIHYDPLYTPGALADCGEALCCQRANNAGPSKAAGYWGDYRVCDSPWRTVTNALEHIKRTHKKIDLIYNTGDIVDHMIWGTSKEKNNEVLTKINNLLEEVFPGIPVYSSVGNHEPHPLNVFGPPDAPEEINVKWMYDHLNSLWRKWLPADTEKTIRTGGYYTVTPKPGFRIISLNNNDCYIFNWWIYYNGSSVLPQLEWLHDTLLAAERAGEYVHILAHIPSGDGDCWTVWAREYNRVIERFRHTISGIFNGHTHVDELNVHYTAKGNAVGISWNGGSLTSYTRKNPNYKIFRLTPKTMEVVDFETWIFNLTEANQHGADKSPKWFKEYVFSEEFQNDLSPAGMDRLLEKMADNPKLLRKFWRFKHTSAEPRIANGWDKKCLRRVICRLSKTVFDQTARCEELQKRLEIGLENELPDEPNKPEEPGDGGDGGDGSATSVIAFQMTSLLGIAVVSKIFY